MSRHLVFLTLLALTLLPDWASAFGRRRYRVAAPPACPPVVLVPLCGPAYRVTPAPAKPVAPPTVTAEPSKSEPKAEAAPKPPAPGIPMSQESPPAPVRPAALAVPEPTPPVLPPEPTPALQLKPADGPSGPAPVVPLVVPQPAKDETIPTIPKLTPALPGTADGLPPLAIPQQAEPGKTTARSSPLSGAPRPVVDVFPVDGPPPTAAKRKVGFFNHADRDVRLTVEGETVTLPRRHYVSAELPAKFVWKLDGGAERTTEVPATAPGVEVVIRK